jgi:hypothetical protein
MAGVSEPAAGILMSGQESTKAVSICLIFVVAVSLNLNLTRRANHGHKSIIAEITKPAPQTARGFFFARG